VDKLQAGFGLHQGKSFLTSSTVAGVPTATPTSVLGLGHANGVALNINGQVAPRQRISDEEFLRLGPVEMLKFVRKTESDIARLAAEQHRQIQSLVRLLCWFLPHLALSLSFITHCRDNESRGKTRTLG
jgi:hypothetical protein